MGAFLDKPKTDKTNQRGEGNGLRYGLSSMQGWRVEMEDAHCAVTQLPAKLKDWSFFAVFDGHAGAKVSFYCAEQLLEHILTNKDFKSSLLDAQPSLEKIKTGIRTGFLDLDTKMRTIPEIQSGEDKSGSTAVGLLISPQHLFFANCGDSRGILIRDGKVVFSTQDHKPSNPSEKERIVNAGGSVMIQRVNGSLAVSRALGDFEYKCVDGIAPTEQMVSPEPEITVLDRQPTDQICVLACDGIWDVLTNDDLCNFILNRMQLTNSLEDICNQVVDTCLYKGSKDNMSIVLIAFEGAPRYCPDAAVVEEELNQRLGAKIKDLMENYEPQGGLTMSALMHELQQAHIEGLPPGGGLHAKHSTIEEFYQKYRPVTDTDSQLTEQEAPFPSFWDGP